MTSNPVRRIPRARTNTEKRRDRITRLKSEARALRDAKVVMTHRLEAVENELASLEAAEAKKHA